MKTVFEYKKVENLVMICSFHRNRGELEEIAKRRFPGIPVSHGICKRCAVRILDAMKKPGEGWLPDPKTKEKGTENETIPGNTKNRL